MRIAIDMISAGSGLGVGVGGMRTYYEGLIGELVKLASDDEIVAFTDRSYETLSLPASPRLRGVDCRGVPSGRFGRVGYEQTVLPVRARAHDADVLLSTVNIRPLGWRRASVVVLQSLQTFILPDRNRSRHLYLRALMPSALRGADGVIAVSETSRREAIRLFDLDPERVFTVHHGCAQWALDASARFVVDGPPPTPPPLGDRPYIANVSALYGLKNHRRLIEAFGLLASRTRFPHDLVLAGGEADVTKAELAEVARRAGVGSRVQILGRYPQEDLPALYANADAIAYPSLYETFGLPVLEAFAFRRPLLTSVISGCGEVAGNAAVKVDPRSVESIAAGLEQVVGDVQLREQIVEAGTKRLEDFSWARCAHGTLTALHAAVARRSSLGRRGARPSNASVS